MSDTQDAIAAFLARGGKVNKVADTARTMTERQMYFAVRDPIVKRVVDDGRGACQARQARNAWMEGIIMFHPTFGNLTNLANEMTDETARLAIFYTRDRLQANFDLDNGQEETIYANTSLFWLGRLKGEVK